MFSKWGHWTALSMKPVKPKVSEDENKLKEHSEKVKRKRKKRKIYRLKNKILRQILRFSMGPCLSYIYKLYKHFFFGQTIIMSFLQAFYSYFWKILFLFLFHVKKKYCKNLDVSRKLKRINVRKFNKNRSPVERKHHSFESKND